MNNSETNNQVQLIGEVVKEFSFSHEILGEKFFTTLIKVPRLNDKFDIIPIMVSERLVDMSWEWTDSCLRITGQFRSRNRRTESGRNKLELFFFATDAEALESMESVSDRDRNIIRLDAYICKEPIYRETPLGREIADVLLAVNRMYGKTDYLPSICWGRSARFASKLAVGTHVAIVGRIQSRTYMKAQEDGSAKECTAWEVSVQTIRLVEDEKGGQAEC